MPRLFVIAILFNTTKKKKEQKKKGSRHQKHKNEKSIYIEESTQIDTDRTLFIRSSCDRNMNKEKKYLMEKCRLPTKATPRVSRKQPVCGNSEGNTCGSGHLVQIDLQGATFEPGAVVELHAFIRLLGTRVANETAAPRLAILLLDFGELDLARLLELLLEFARVPCEWNLSRKKRKFHLCHLFYSGK